ncbi:hypothetical protein HPB50_028254 [Hyalomma asiaticum]|nr:hypothetical protein HPB50_028254 [Hyalomma asiaticum]
MDDATQLASTEQLCLRLSGRHNECSRSFHVFQRKYHHDVMPGCPLGRAERKESAALTSKPYRISGCRTGHVLQEPCILPSLSPVVWENNEWSRSRHVFQRKCHHDLLWGYRKGEAAAAAVAAAALTSIPDTGFRAVGQATALE